MIMKKSWSRKAVSPVIATILMVAITVVLAAVLYVMVMGFGGNTPQAPAVTLSKDTVNDRVIVNIQPATAFADVKYTLTINGVAGSITNINAAQWTDATSGSTMKLVFTDAGSDSKVTTGDYFQLSGALASGETVTLNLLWANGDTTQNLGSIAL